MTYGSNVDGLVLRATPLLRQMLTDTTWMLERDDACRIQSEPRYLLHRTDGLYSIWSMIFAPGVSTPVHDHNVWGLTAVWYGQETEECFVREAEGEDFSTAVLRCVDRNLNVPGRVSVLVPPRDIHRVANVSHKLARSIHIYGDTPGKISSREYDLASGRVNFLEQDQRDAADVRSVQNSSGALRALLGYGSEGEV
jgi:3-mercaptopropionate dioxygenase